MAIIIYVSIAAISIFDDLSVTVKLFIYSDIIRQTLIH